MFADAYETLNGRREGATERELLAYQRIQTMSITVATPVLLELFVRPTSDLPVEQREMAILAIESYLVRRMLAREQTRAYGQVFVEVLRAVRQADLTAANAVVASLQGSPHSYPWPTTEAITAAFTSSRYYGSGGLNQKRLRMVLGGVDKHLQAQAVKSEPVILDYDSLQVEHIIPQSWREFWPLDIDDPVERLTAEAIRDRKIHWIGNLTLATGPLNLELSHSPWATKKVSLAEHSHLKLNQALLNEAEWNEERITDRGRWLAQQVDEVWKGPQSEFWVGDNE